MKAWILATFLAAPLVASTAIDEIVPWEHTNVTSQAAEFHWLFESESGTEPRIINFGCGTYGVGPAVGDTGVRLISLGGDAVGNADLITLDADPTLNSNALLTLSVSAYGRGNAAEDEMDDLPKVFTPAAGEYIALVACKNRDYGETPQIPTAQSANGQVDAYNVVIILSAALFDDPVIGPALLAGEAIRPPQIAGGHRQILTWADFDLTRMPVASVFTGAAAAEVTTTARRWRYSTDVFALSVWDGAEIDSWGEAGRCYRPVVITSDYGSYWAKQQTSDILGLLMAGSATTEQRKPAIAALISHGYDSWNARHGMSGSLHGVYASGAGQWLGGFTSSAFFAALAIDDQYGNALKNVIVQEMQGIADRRGPQEMRQTSRGRTGQLLWGTSDSESVYWGEFRYYANYDAAVTVGGTDNLNRTSSDPYGYIDGPPGEPGDNYFRIDNAGQRAFSGLMLVWPEFRAIVNTDRPIEFTHRAETHGLWTWPDPVATMPYIDQFGIDPTCDPAGGGLDCNRYMRHDLPDGWGPDNTRAGAYAIEHTNNGAGRFASIHGANALTNPAHEISRFESYDTQFFALYTGDTYEDWYTPLDKVVPPEIFVAPDSEGAPVTYIFCATPGAAIHYTLDGSEPTASSPVYSTPLTLTGVQTPRARAFLDGRKASKVASAAGLESSPAPERSTRIGGLGF